MRRGNDTGASSDEQLGDSQPDSSVVQFPVSLLVIEVNEIRHLIGSNVNANVRKTPAPTRVVGIALPPSLRISRALRGLSLPHLYGPFSFVVTDPHLPFLKLEPSPLGGGGASMSQKLSDSYDVGLAVTFGR